MTIEPDRTALVLTDLQNDFLTAGGNGWSLFADSYAKLDTVANLQRLLQAAKDSTWGTGTRKLRLANPSSRSTCPFTKARKPSHQSEHAVSDSVFKSNSAYGGHSELIIGNYGELWRSHQGRSKVELCDKAGLFCSNAIRRLLLISRYQQEVPN